MADMKAGYFEANPVKVELTRTLKNNIPMLRMVCGVIDEEGIVHEMDKHGGLSGEGLQYTCEDAERLGCDITLPMKEWKVDTKRKVKVKVEMDGQYGLKMKSIYDFDSNGPAISKPMTTDQASEISASMEEHLKAIREKKGNKSGVPF